MENEIPYIPDLFKAVIARVNTFFSTRDTDPFNVCFDYGVYSQVGKNIVKSNTATFPLVWLEEPYDQLRGSANKYCKFSGKLIIAMPTEPSYTSDQRTDLIFKPTLIPIYKKILEELSFDTAFGLPIVEEIEHKRKDWKYWGGGDVAGSDTKNLFKNFVDAIEINGLKLDISFSDCLTT